MLKKIKNILKRKRKHDDIIEKLRIGFKEDIRWMLIIYCVNRFFKEINWWKKLTNH